MNERFSLEEARLQQMKRRLNWPSQILRDKSGKADNPSVNQEYRHEQVLRSEKEVFPQPKIEASFSNRFLQSRFLTLLAFVC